jgi:UDP-N-acetylglucosamine acyltransferase
MSIHPTAIIDPQAQIADDVTIGPYVVIEGPVKIGSGSVIKASAYITGDTTLGKNCQVFSHTDIGEVPQDKNYKGEHSRVVIGDDCILREGVTIHRGTGEGTVTTIGNRCFLMSNAHVGHNCTVGDDCILISGCLLGGHVQVDERAVISGNTALHQFVRVGKMAMLGGVAPIVQDVPPYALTNHDGHVVSINVVGLKRAGFSSEERSEIKEAYRLIYRESLPLGQVVAMLTQNPCSEVLQPLVDFLSGSNRGIVKGSMRVRRAA